MTAKGVDMKHGWILCVPDRSGISRIFMDCDRGITPGQTMGVLRNMGFCSIKVILSDSCVVFMSVLCGWSSERFSE